MQRAIELDKLLQACQFPSISIHGGLPQDERYNRRGSVPVASTFVKTNVVSIKHSIRRYKTFKEFNKRMMVATDIFGRGIDVERVNIVINYDMPDSADSYLHRVSVT